MVTVLRVWSTFLILKYAPAVGDAGNDTVNAPDAALAKIVKSVARIVYVVLTSTVVLAKLDDTVTDPVDPDNVIPEPAVNAVTPVFAIVTLPVAPDTEIPVPATLLNTPVLLNVVPDNERPVPA